MRRLIPVLALILLLTPPAAGQDFDIGLEAYGRSDYATALREFRPLAEEGDPDAQFLLGEMHYYGQGVPQDYVKAVTWLRLAAEQGLVFAQYDLVVVYTHGQGVPQDYTEAAKWAHRAAEQGLDVAQYSLGVMYHKGQGVPQDYAEAAKWYRVAAEQGVALAQNNLGLMYSDGHGVRQDYTEAVKWLRLAAQQGNALAQFNLAKRYVRGQGVPQDYVQAHMWLNLAAAQGDQKAQIFRENIERKMTRSQVAEAQRLARTWSPGPSVAAVTPPSDPPKTREDVRRVQRDLASLGYSPGPADGVLGRKTRAAIRLFQSEQGLPVTGEVSSQLEAAIQKAIRARSTAGLSERRGLEKVSAGSGFQVSSEGHVLTNNHVIEGCVAVRSTVGGLPHGTGVGTNPHSVPHVLNVLDTDRQNDLALLNAPIKTQDFAKFRGGRGIRTGEDVMVAGFPLHGILTSDLNVTKGTVSALAGPGDDRRFIQITAPVQPGNSGGPVIDTSGNIVGVVVSRLDALKFAQVAGVFPQNVNFAISEGTVRAFLDANDIPYETLPSKEAISGSDIAGRAKLFTMLIECWK